MDLWHGGENVLLDPGTFSYNEAPPWDNPLAHSAFHNAPTVDGLDSMERFGKFLWLPWARARETKRQDELQVRYREFTHNGYERLASPVRVRRGIIVADDGCILVIDALSSAEPHRYALQWLFPDRPYTWSPDARRLSITISTGQFSMAWQLIPAEETVSLVRADPESPRGWSCPSYHQKVPALSVRAEAGASDWLCLTLFGPGQPELHWADPEFEISSVGHCFAGRVSTSGGPLITGLQAASMRSKETSTRS